nr:hypothetical protein [[Eubacterium] tenue]
MYILTYNTDTKLCGSFYKIGIHKNIPTPNIHIDKKLYDKLLGDVYKIKDEIQIEQRVYTIDDFELFEVVKQEQAKPKPSLMDTQIAEMTLELANKDIQIKELETQQAQSLLELAEKDLKIKNLENDMANVILQLSIGGIK